MLLGCGGQPRAAANGLCGMRPPQSALLCPLPPLAQLPSPPEALDAMVKNTPAQRWAQPEEVGEVAAFLCSPRSAFVTGVAIPVDGGLHLR